MTASLLPGGITGAVRTKLELERIDLQSERSQLLKRVDDINARSRAIDELRRIDRLDDDTLNRAAVLLSCNGAVTSGERSRVVRDAASEIAKGGGRLRVEYFGTKHYDRWSDQRCDCAYGCAPRHGTIVFSVGLWNPWHPLDEDDIECCLYALDLLLQRKIDGSQIATLARELRKRNGGET